MPLSKKGTKIMRSMKAQYGNKKGENVFYASKNAGKISGVEKKKKPALGSGKRFAELSGKVARSYEKKGKSPKEARRIGSAVAAIAGRRAHGAKTMTRLAKAGKKHKLQSKLSIHDRISAPSFGGKRMD